jgi:hypothetical protein
MSDGTKHDEGKNPLNLLPTEALREIGKVLQHGIAEYGEWNWKKGMKWSRPYAAALRHMYAFAEREDVDKECGTLHLANACCNLMFLLTFQLLGLGEDDRWQKEEKK